MCLHSRSDCLLAAMRALDRHYEAEMSHLRIVHDLVDAMDRRERHVVGAEPLDPMLQWMTRELRIERSPEGFIVIDASLARAIALVGADVRRRQRADETVPELLQRRKMDRDQAAVGSAQDVRLRQA